MARMTPAPAALPAPVTPYTQRSRRKPAPYVEVTIQLPAAVASLVNLRCALLDESVSTFYLESALRRFDD